MSVVDDKLKLIKIHEHTPTLMIYSKQHQLFSGAVFMVGIVVLSFNCHIQAQNINSTVPESINPDHRYVFYLHGAIVQQQGANAVSEQHGPYEYQNILSALASLNYQVISEVRPKDSQIDTYAKKIASEINALRSSGVPAKRITVVGASLGAYMAVETAYNLQNNEINYALLGMCSDYAIDYFKDRRDKICGNFFSIYETSDGPGSCEPLLGDNACNKGFKELALNMGNSHGFLYKPYPEWVEPLQQWIDGQ